MATDFELNLMQILNSLNICSCADEKINKIKFCKKPHLLNVIVEYYRVILNKMFNEPFNIETSNNDINENGKRIIIQECNIKMKRPFIEYDVAKLNNSEQSSSGETESYQEILTRCCINVASLICNLSFVAGNDLEVCKNSMLLSLMSTIINSKYCKFCSVTKFNDLTFNSKWYDALFTLRQITMLTLATISDKLEFHYFNSTNATEFLYSLIHFICCPNIHHEYVSNDAISVKQFSFEILSKISVYVQYLQLIDQSPKLFNKEKFIKDIARAINPNSDSSTRNFSINFLSNYFKFNQSIVKTLLTYPDVIMWLLDFIQDCQENAMNMVKENGLQFFKSNSHTIGSTPEIIRKAAEILKKLSTNSEFVLHFKLYHEKIAKLSMSKLIEEISPILVEILQDCSFIPKESFMHSLQSTSTFSLNF